MAIVPSWVPDKKVPGLMKYVPVGMDLGLDLDPEPGSRQRFMETFRFSDARKQKTVTDDPISCRSLVPRCGYCHC